MNYVVQYATLRDGEWVRPKYQTMSANDRKDLGERFYRMYDRETTRAEIVYWWVNGIRQQYPEKKKGRAPAGTGYAAKSND